MIESMDTQIGRVLEAPDANGLTENTIVISLIPRLGSGGARRQAPVPGLGMPGPLVGIDEAPPRRPSVVEPLIDLMADRGIKAAVGLGELLTRS
jgi:hypothetical protein